MKYLIVHHSVTGHNVLKSHVASWPYTKIIRWTGEIQDGQDTYHTYGHNNDSLAVCLIGNFQTEKPNQRQLDSLIKILRNWKKRFNNVKIIGHRDLKDNPPGHNYTACPGKNLYKLLPQIREEVMENYKAKWKKCMHYKDNRIEDLEKCRKELKETKDLLELQKDMANKFKDNATENAKRIEAQDKMIQDQGKEIKTLKKRLRASKPVKDGGFWYYIRLAIESLKNGRTSE